MLCWIDLETTGLVAAKEQVLEVACVITRDDLTEVARFERVLKCNVAFDALSPFIREMHTKNGLWPLVERSLYSAVDVDEDLSAFINQHAITESVDQTTGKITVNRPQLAGSTISFDRSFIEVHLPNTSASLHYRNVDVSTLNEMSKRIWPEAYAGRPQNENGSAHRAMADIEASIAVAKYYASALTVRGAA